MLKKISLLAVSAIASFGMSTFEINISDKDLAVSTQFDIGQFDQTVVPETTYFGFSFLNGDEDHSTKKDIEPYYEINFLKIRELGNSAISLGLGLKANYTKKYITIPLGIELKYKADINIVPMEFKTSLYYAPEVLAFSSAIEFFELGANVSIEVIENSYITLGYRKLATNYEKVKFVYNHSGYLGFKFDF